MIKRVSSIIVSLAIFMTGCSTFSGLHQNIPPASWVIQIHSDDLPKVSMAYAEIYSCGDVSVNRNVLEGGSNVPYVAAVKLTTNEIFQIYGCSLRLLRDFHFKPSAILLPDHGFSLRLFTGSTGMEISQGSYKDISSYPSDFKRIWEIIDSHKPEYVDGNKAKDIISPSTKP